MAKAGAKEDSPVTVESLYSDLQRYGDAQSYDKVIQTADAILKLNSDELEAFQSKIVAYIHKNDFKNALSIMDRDKRFTSETLFEKAYCLYRLNKNQEALQALTSTENLDIRCRELKAQLLYRMEEYHDSLQLYKDVLKNSQDDYDDERQTNFSAVMACLTMYTGDSSVESPSLEDDSYERCYNAACFLIGRGDYHAAENELKRAESLCQQSFEDDDELSEMEKDDELAVIRVQMAYCAQMLGRTTDAMSVYSAVLKNKPSDVAVTAVAANNTVTLNQDQNVFDSKKKMKLTSSTELTRKLTRNQTESIDVNQCLLMYYANQADACRTQCKALGEKYPANDMAPLVESCLLVKSKQQIKAIQLLETRVEESSDPSLTLQLTLAQLHLSQGNISNATNILRKLGPDTYKPAVVSLLLSLFMSREDNSSVADIFSDVISWFEKNNVESPIYRQILQAAADFQMKFGDPRLAAELLERLRAKTKGDDRAILSNLFAAYSQFDPSKAKKVSSQLPSVEALAESIDVDALEESSSLMGNKYRSKKDEKTAASAEVADELLTKKKKNKKKKGKLPKEYNPDVDPDPERWLPRRERSTWKGRRRDKRKENIGKGSQGATAGGGPELDITKMESTTDSATHVPQSSTRGYSASKQQQKKKKRSKK